MSLSKIEVGLRFDDQQPATPIGSLATSGRGLFFEWEPSFLEPGVGHALPLSPFKLPVRPGLLPFDGGGRFELFGVFEDAMPDGWGRRLMDRHFRQTLGRQPTALERLAFLGEHAMGALTFHPPATAGTEAKEVLDLSALARNARAVYADEAAEALPELLAIGGSPGGARPKALIGLPEDPRIKGVRRGDGPLPDGFAHWLVKFHAKEDGHDCGALEYAYAEMAALAGADVPTRRLLETKAGAFFAVRRFDRPTPRQRLHLHSAAGLLHADFRTPGTEYDTLFRLTAALTRDHAQARELFRRAALNVLACNRDDHLKNFAFLMDARGAWRLTPLYDFTFHEGPGGWHTLSVAGEGKSPGTSNLLRLAGQAQLKAKEAGEILTQVKEAVAALPRLAKNAGVTAKTLERVRKRLARIA